MKILVIDVGGTHVKVHRPGHREPVKIPSGPKMTAKKLVADVKKLSAGWTYSAVSIGYPGAVIHDRPVSEPYHLGGGWVGFDFRGAFGHRVKIVNDAAMQALGSYEGGRMLFLGLGTGLGSALIVDGVLESMELAHLLYRKGRTFEDYIGLTSLKRLGKKKWRHRVADVVRRLKAALQADYVVLGVGNARLLETLPAKARLGDNSNAFLGGSRLWQSRGRFCLQFILERTAKRSFFPWFVTTVIRIETNVALHPREHGLNMNHSARENCRSQVDASGVSRAPRLCP